MFFHSVHLCTGCCWVCTDVVTRNSVSEFHTNRMSRDIFSVY